MGLHGVDPRVGGGRTCGGDGAELDGHPDLDPGGGAGGGAGGQAGLDQLGEGLGAV